MDGCVHVLGIVELLNDYLHKLEHNFMEMSMPLETHGNTLPSTNSVAHECDNSTQKSNIGYVYFFVVFLVLARVLILPSDGTPSIDSSTTTPTTDTLANKLHDEMVSNGGPADHNKDRVNDDKLHESQSNVATKAGASPPPTEHKQHYLPLRKRHLLASSTGNYNINLNGVIILITFISF